MNKPSPFYFWTALALGLAVGASGALLARLVQAVRRSDVVWLPTVKPEAVWTDPVMGGPWTVTRSPDDGDTWHVMQDRKDG